MEKRDGHNIFDVYEDQDVEVEKYKEIQCIRRGIDSIDKTLRLIGNCVLFGAIFWATHPIIKGVFEAMKEFFVYLVKLGG